MGKEIKLMGIVEIWLEGWNDNFMVSYNYNNSML